MPELSYHELSEQRMTSMVHQAASAIILQQALKPAPPKTRPIAPPLASSRLHHEPVHLVVAKKGPENPVAIPIQTIARIREKPTRIGTKEPAQPQNDLEKYFVDACNAVALYRSALAAANKIEAFEVHKLWLQLDKLKP